MSFSTSVNSFSAAGCTPPKVATRMTTSWRRRSGSCSSTAAALPRSRCTSSVAMICGCSSRISSTTSVGFELVQALHAADRFARLEDAFQQVCRAVVAQRLVQDRLQVAARVQVQGRVLLGFEAELFQDRADFFALDLRQLGHGLADGLDLIACDRCCSTLPAPSSPSDISRMALFRMPSSLFHHFSAIQCLISMATICGSLLGCFLRILNVFLDGARLALLRFHLAWPAAVGVCGIWRACGLALGRIGSAACRLRRLQVLAQQGAQHGKPQVQGQHAPAAGICPPSWPARCSPAGATPAIRRTSMVSEANGLFTTFSESPRSALKPMASLTRLLTCSSSVADRALAERLPLASTLPR